MSAFLVHGYQLVIIRGLDMRLVMNNLGSQVLGCHEDFTPEAVGVFLPSLAPTRREPKHSPQAAQLQTSRPISLSGSFGIHEGSAMITLTKAAEVPVLITQWRRQDLLNLFEAVDSTLGCDPSVLLWLSLKRVLRS